MMNALPVVLLVGDTQASAQKLAMSLSHNLKMRNDTISMWTLPLRQCARAKLAARSKPCLVYTGPGTHKQLTAISDQLTHLVLPKMKTCSKRPSQQLGTRVLTWPAAYSPSDADFVTILDVIQLSNASLRHAHYAQRPFENILTINLDSWQTRHVLDPDAAVKALPLHEPVALYGLSARDEVWSAASARCDVRWWFDAREMRWRKSRQRTRTNIL
jgi:hypothetical protein